MKHLGQFMLWIGVIKSLMVIDWLQVVFQKIQKIRYNFYLAKPTIKSIQLQIITRTGKQYATRNQPDFAVLAETDCYYPITKVLWTPVKVSLQINGYGLFIYLKQERRENDLIVTSSDQLRVYELIDTNRGHSIVKKRELIHVK